MIDIGVSRAAAPYGCGVDLNFPCFQLKYRQFVEQNCLALTFSCTSSRDASVRKLAYCVLQRFLSLLQVPLVVLFLPDTSCSASSSILLQELDIESADDRYRNLYVYLLRFFKQSIEQDAPRLPHSRFLRCFYTATIAQRDTAARRRAAAIDLLYGPIGSGGVHSATVAVI